MNQSSWKSEGGGRISDDFHARVESRRLFRTRATKRDAFIEAPRQKAQVAIFLPVTNETLAPEYRDVKLDGSRATNETLFRTETDPRLAAGGRKGWRGRRRRENESGDSTFPRLCHDKPFHRVMRSRLAIGVKRSVMRQSISSSPRTCERALFTLSLCERYDTVFYRFI